jgi:hypothetical protein
MNLLPAATKKDFFRGIFRDISLNFGYDGDNIHLSLLFGRRLRLQAIIKKFFNNAPAYMTRFKIFVCECPAWTFWPCVGGKRPFKATKLPPISSAVF